MSGGTQPTSEENVDSDDPVPSAPPLYPLLPADTPTGVVSFPDPDPHAGKGLVTFAHFVGCARSAIA